MKLILLSGGSGKRLWPISNDARSKQFLKVLANKQGDRVSMLQRVWSQLDSVDLSQSAIISMSKSQVDMIHNQIEYNVPVIVEPERRDTFPAIALAAAYLYSVEGVGLNEVITVLPVDSYVEDTFFHKVKELEQVVQSSGAEFALMGVEPTFPSEKYGYIAVNPNDFEEPYFTVRQFHEKPKTAKAKELIKDGAFWNCGVFAFKLDTIISILSAKGFPIQYEELLFNYNRLPQISFDYEVLEKSGNIVVTRYDGYWKDLGTWNTLTEEMAEPVTGKGVISHDCVNTHVVNELDIPIAVLGLSNVIVAASPDGILVTDKNESARLKELIRFEQRLMYQERRWGWYRVLDYTKFDEGSEVLTRRIKIDAGKNLSYQLHYKRSEVWTVISGEGEAVIDGNLFKVKPGDVVQIPLETKHGIKAITDLEFIEVQTGIEVIEEDVVRIHATWDELMGVIA